MKIISAKFHDSIKYQDVNCVGLENGIIHIKYFCIDP